MTWVMAYSSADLPPELMEKPGWGYRGDNPVVYVRWKDAQDYAEWLTYKTNSVYRLPSSKEWVFAAGGGNKPQRFENSDIELTAWLIGNSESHTQPVASLRPNELGLYDMIGNVEEWCKDQSYFETNSDVGPDSDFSDLWDDPFAESDHSKPNVLGGSWNSKEAGGLKINPWSIELVENNEFDHVQENTIGFRVVRELRHDER